MSTAPFGMVPTAAVTAGPYRELSPVTTGIIPKGVHVGRHWAPDAVFYGEPKADQQFRSVYGVCKPSRPSITTRQFNQGSRT